MLCCGWPGQTSKEKYSANMTKPTALYMYIITNARNAVCHHVPPPPPSLLQSLIQPARREER